MEMEKSISVRKIRVARGDPSNFLLSTVPPGKGTVWVIAESGQSSVYETMLLRGERTIVCRFKNAGAVIGSDADLVLLDCGFDKEKGLRVLSGIKEDRPDLPVIFIVESGSKETVIAALRAGARDFVERPFDLLALGKKIEDFLSVKRTSRERRSMFRADEPPEVCSGPASTDLPLGVLRAIQYIQESLTEKINLQRLARQAGMSKFHFCRLFLKHAGMSPMKYVTFSRIELAKKHLERGDSNVSLLALDLGFNDLGTFIRQFKRQTGFTPTSYQDSLRSPLALKG